MCKSFSHNYLHSTYSFAIYKESILHCLFDKRFTIYEKNWALEYLEKMFGIGLIISDVLPSCNDADLLIHLSARIPQKTVSKLLDEKLWDAYRVKADMTWLTELIRHNNPEALSVYYKMAKKLMTLPDMVNEPFVPTTTEAIRNVDSLQCLPILIDLFKLSFSSGFVDREYFGLNASCWNAIRTIGQKNYEVTRNLLLESQDGNPPAAFETAAMDLLHSIEDSLPWMLDKPLDFEHAIIITSE